MMLFVLSAGAQTRRTVSKKKPAASKVTKKKRTTKKKSTAKYTNSSIKGLQRQQANVQKKIKEQERLLRANRADVKKRLGSLMLLNTEISQRQKSIDNINTDLSGIEEEIKLLETQLSTLETQLNTRKENYVKSMRYIARQRGVQDKLMFIFSADNFTQMYRRMRFVRDYASHQRTQGELVKAKQLQINDKRKELEAVRAQKNALLDKDRKEKAELQSKQDEQKKMVSSLQKQQKTIQNVISEQKKKSADLNAKIDKLIAEEVAKAKARAEAEARRKAKAAAEAKKKREAELARKKAEAEAAARENARRVAEAKEREERLKAEAAAAEGKSEAERQRTRQAALKAEADRQAAERKARIDKQRHDDALAKAKKHSDEVVSVSTEDRALNKNFESNRGRLPMPIAGAYKIVSRFGQYVVEGLKNVTLDNKGISIMGSAGATVRAVFDGEVSAVFGFGDTKVVMVRHGQFISVYCNLKSVDVRRGQKVSVRQSLGRVGADKILQFQLRKGTAKLNPESWLGR